MSEYATCDRLTDCLIQLERQWLLTHEIWTDSMSYAFETDYYQPIHSETQEAIRALDNFLRLTAEAHRQVR